MPDVDTAAGTRLVFSADTVLRFQRGHMLIHAIAATQPFVTDQPALIGWLAQFAQPITLETALGQLQGGAREFAARAVAFLRQSGALTEVANANAEWPPSEAAHERSRALLVELTQAVYELGCDVAAFGPAAEDALRR